MSLNEDTARALVEAAHAAWNAGDLEGVLQKYVDDLIYVSNVEGANGQPLVIHGKEAMRSYLCSFQDAVESKTAIESFYFENGIARIRLSAFVRHKRSGHVLTGSFRQIMQFRGFQISKLDDLHDAAKMNAFWRLVHSEISSSD